MHTTITMKASAEIFKNLALDVGRIWSGEAEDPERFPAIATRLLNDFEYDLDQTSLDKILAEWMVAAPQLPEQVNLHNTFGEPPITLFNNGKFVVEIYIWRGCDTSLHSHGFRGAFRVLHGQSLHETFKVRVKEEISADVELTELEVAEMEILETGSVRTIHPGKALTHRVIHLVDPTVTLCVKTINEKSLCQWHHFGCRFGDFENGLAIQKRHIDPSLIKQIYYFQYLASRDGKSAKDFLDAVLARQDISTLMNLCEELASGAYGISEEFVQYVLEDVYGLYDGQEWFRRYENAMVDPADHISFERFVAPHMRLVAHFMNQGIPFSSVKKMLPGLTASEVIPFIDAKRLAAFLES